MIAAIQTDPPLRLTLEHNMNYVPSPFLGEIMSKPSFRKPPRWLRSALFIGMIAIWSQVLGNF